MRYYLIAGEASGDLHGANLMRGILKADPEAQFRFWGGDKMAEAGGRNNLVKHYKETSFMGFTEVLKNLRTILGQIAFCRQDIEHHRPDLLILIDYAGFNLRIARFAHAAGIPVYYYIAPKVWAWKESRVKLLQRYVDRLFVIFPFEVPYFQRWGIDAIYEGNPLMDAIAARRDNLPSRENVPSRQCPGRSADHRAVGRQSPFGNRLQSAVHGEAVPPVSAIPICRGRRVVARSQRLCAPSGG